VFKSLCLLLSLQNFSAFSVDSLGLLQPERKLCGHLKWRNKGWITPLPREGWGWVAEKTWRGHRNFGGRMCVSTSHPPGTAPYKELASKAARKTNPWQLRNVWVGWESGRQPALEASAKAALLGRQRRQMPLELGMWQQRKPPLTKCFYFWPRSEPKTALMLSGQRLPLSLFRYNGAHWGSHYILVNQWCLVGLHCKNT
jgi:hypothetical protein